MRCDGTFVMLNWRGPWRTALGFGTGGLCENDPDLAVTILGFLVVYGLS